MKTVKNILEVTYGAGIDMARPMADLSASVEKKITQSDLNQVEKYADKLFAALGIDVEFTKHFMDRVNDARNIKQITTSELVRLFKQSYKSLLNLKPCLMMSPASASQFLPKRPDIFDVLVIDEASQMKPELALGLIARCKQIIIVGDDKQLPPSNWFEKKQDSDDDDGEYEIEDDESILDLSTKVLNKNKCICPFMTSFNVAIFVAFELSPLTQIIELINVVLASLISTKNAHNLDH